MDPCMQAPACTRPARAAQGARLARAVAAGLLLAAGAQAHAQGQPPAQTQAQLYGTIDVAAGQLSTQAPGAPNAAIVTVKGVHSGALQTSFIGFRGSEDLGGGLRARFVLESFIRVDTGQYGRFDATPAAGADGYWAREAYAALASATLGEVRIGNNAHPTWIAMIQSSALGSNSVFSPGFRQLFNGSSRGRSEVDTAMVNSVKYQSPVWGGVSGSAVVQAGEGSGSGASYSAHVGWRAGPLFVTAAGSRLRHAAPPNLPGLRRQDIALVGASYDFGVVKLFAQHTWIDNDRLNNKDRVPHVGLQLPLGLGTLQLAHGHDRNTANASRAVSDRKTTSAGYVHPLSKRTEIYAFAMRDQLPVGDADSWVSGIRHQF